MGRQENEAARLHHLQEEAETGDRRGSGGRLEPQVLLLRHLLPPTKLRLLKVPQLPQTAPPSGDKVFNYTSLWGSFHTQTITVFGL